MLILVPLVIVQPRELSRSGDSKNFWELALGEVLIRIKAAGFNPVDWKIREGWYGGVPPKILGMDCSGIVDEVGPNTKTKK